MTVDIDYVVIVISFTTHPSYPINNQKLTNFLEMLHFTAFEAPAPVTQPKIITMQIKQ